MAFLAILAVGIFVAAFHRATYQPRMWSPLWLAFNTTLGSAMFLVAGIIGYQLDKRTRFFTGAGWSDGVIWWQIWVGIALAAAAAPLWRRGLRSLQS